MHRKKTTYAEPLPYNTTLRCLTAAVASPLLLLFLSLLYICPRVVNPSPGLKGSGEPLFFCQ